MNNNRIRNILIISGFLVMLLIAGFLIYNGRRRDYDERIVGFIMNGRIEENGWNSEQYNGIKEVCDDLDIKLLVRESIEEGTGKCSEAIENLINKGAGAIVLLSYNYVQEAGDVINANKNIIFYTTDAESGADNVIPFFSRLYQARYLSGIIAGMATESGKIGYVAAMDNSEVNRGINAFALGVQRVNKDAVVIVERTGGWENESAEVAAADKLIDAGVDVLTCHQNMGYSVEEADRKGIYTIGYHSGSDEASDKLLTSIECDWSAIYNIILSEYCKGTSGRQKHYWIGIEDGAVSLAPYSDLVTDDMKAEVSKAKDEIISGRDVFSGVIFDNKGELRCMRGETMTDDNILNNVDWLVKGVQLYEE
ncbi:MAG: BMP family ABC transporter substrate-binding protein [Lachnospiraceae bacterium]|nr:BMP family ABC transporter substrate-binding protein [Lachnospiraceae bacterium]